MELNPNDPDSLMALAKAQVRFGDYADAVANAERARRLHPMAPEYYTYVHGQALYAAGRPDEADGVLGECLLRAPQEADCLLIRAAFKSSRARWQRRATTMAQLRRPIRNSRSRPNATTAGSAIRPSWTASLPTWRGRKPPRRRTRRTCREIAPRDMKSPIVEMKGYGASAPHFEIQVEGRFGGTAEMREARFAENIGQTRLPCLRPKH